MRNFDKALLISLVVGVANGFAPLASSVMSTTMTATTTARNMLPMEISQTLLSESSTLLLSSSSTLTLAETEAWVQPTAAFLDPFLNFLTFAMLARVVLSWYPETKVTEMPWVLLVIPTQPLLKAVRGVIPPAFGVDITPIFWLAIFSFIHEILLGQQGLLTLKLKYGI